PLRHAGTDLDGPPRMAYRFRDGQRQLLAARVPVSADRAGSWRIHSGRMAADWCRSSRADRRGRLARLVWWCRPGPRWRTSEDVTDSPTASRCPMATFEPATRMDRYTRAAPR